MDSHEIESLQEVEGFDNDELALLEGLFQKDLIQKAASQEEISVEAVEEVELTLVDYLKIRFPYLEDSLFKHIKSLTHEALTKLEFIVKALDAVYAESWDLIIDEKAKVFTFTIHFPEITITNSHSKSHKITNLFVRFNFTFLAVTATGTIKGMRTTITKRELCYDGSPEVGGHGSYVHSHLSTTVNSFKEGRFTDFCLGSSQLSSLMMHLIDARNVTEANIFKMLLYISSLVHWESLEGTPYRRINTLSERGSRGRSSWFHRDIKSNLVNILSTHYTNQFYASPQIQALLDSLIYPSFLGAGGAYLVSQSSRPNYEVTPVAIDAYYISAVIDKSLSRGVTSFEYRATVDFLKAYMYYCDIQLVNPELNKFEVKFKKEAFLQDFLGSFYNIPNDHRANNYVFYFFRDIIPNSGHLRWLGQITHNLVFTKFSDVKFNNTHYKVLGTADITAMQIAREILDTVDLKAHIVIPDAPEAEVSSEIYWQSDSNFKFKGEPQKLKVINSGDNPVEVSSEVGFKPEDLQYYLEVIASAEIHVCQPMIDLLNRICGNLLATSNYNNLINQQL